MATVAPTEGAPSPSKKAYMPAPIPPRADPTDLRGSMRVRTEWDDQLKLNPTRTRMAVANGHPSAPSSSSRRPLGPARTEPVLSFAHASVPSYAGQFKSSKDLLDDAYAALHAQPVVGKRADELRPMWETGSASDAASVRAASLRAGDSGFWGAAAAPAPVEDVDGDGFDLDEALGPAKGGLLSFAGFAQVPAPAQDSQGSGSTTHTVTQRMKRSFGAEGPAAVGAGAGAGAAGDDEEMAATDVEDEGDDEPAPLSGFGQLRQVKALWKGWGKTQSLPPDAFAGQMEF
ncbi:hypothetical protein JCM10449v2_001956 [Rhodotorula kratochvilovae]